jgi:ABC-type transport system involved in multi-copper enzyme maturation permease subunit
MKGVRYQRIQFIVWLSVAILSAVWIIFNAITNTGLISLPIYLFVFILGCLSFAMALLSIRKRVSDVKTKINEEKAHEENVKDFYLYQQLLNPPDINN